MNFMTSCLITSWQIDGETMETGADFILFYFIFGLQYHCRWWLQPWNQKTPAPWKKSYDQPRKWSEVKVTQSCLTLCDHMNCIVHGILQDRILEWVTFPFSRGSSQSRDWTQVSRIAGGFFTSWATREALPRQHIKKQTLLRQQRSV